MKVLFVGWVAPNSELGDYGRDVCSALVAAGVDIEIASLDDPEENWPCPVHNLSGKELSKDDLLGLSSSRDVVHVQVADEFWKDNLVEFAKANNNRASVILTLHDSLGPFPPIQFLSFVSVFTEFVLCDSAYPKSKVFGNFIGVGEINWFEPAILKHDLGHKYDFLVLGEQTITDDVEKAAAIANDQLGKDLICLKPLLHSVSRGELVERVIGSHAVIQWYPHAKGYRISHLSPWVVASGRPLVASDTDWFWKISDDYIYRASSIVDLALCLSYVVNNYPKHLQQAQEYKEWYDKQRSVYELARLHFDMYKAATLR